jgi:hypothetical protein
MTIVGVTLPTTGGSGDLPTATETDVPPATACGLTKLLEESTIAVETEMGCGPALTVVTSGKPNPNGPEMTTPERARVTVAEAG